MGHSRPYFSIGAGWYILRIGGEESRDVIGPSSDNWPIVNRYHEYQHNLGVNIGTGIELPLNSRAALVWDLRFHATHVDAPKDFDADHLFTAFNGGVRFNLH